MFILRADSLNGEKSVQICGDYQSLWNVFWSFLESKFACCLSISDGYANYDPCRGSVPVSLVEGQSITIEEAKPFHVGDRLIYIPQSLTEFIPRFAEEKTLFDKGNSAWIVGVGRDVDDLLFGDIVNYVSQHTWEEILTNPVVD